MTFSHAARYELLLIRKSAGGGLEAVRKVERKVRRISMLSSAMAADVSSSKYTWYPRCGNSGTSEDIGTIGPAAGM